MAIENPLFAEYSSEQWGKAENETSPCPHSWKVHLGRPQGRQKINKAVLCQMIGDAIKKNKAVSEGRGAVRRKDVI